MCFQLSKLYLPSILIWNFKIFLFNIELSYNIKDFIIYIFIYLFYNRETFYDRIFEVLIVL